MEIERLDVGSKRCIGKNEVNLMKRLRDGVEDGHIPEWLLVEVLTKLPAKLVCGSKLVSKEWLSLISEPYFVRTYIARSLPLSQQPWTFISNIMHQEGTKFSHFPEYPLLEDISSQVPNPSCCVLPVPSTQPSHGVEDRYLILGVSSGIVLYQLYVQLVATHNFYICNPVTGQWIALPPFTCGDFLMESCGFLTHVEGGILKSYTVVRLDRSYGRSNLVRFGVFFSEIGEWKVHIMSSEISLSLKNEAIALNGILHWMDFGHGIIAYDPHRSPERMRNITLPNEVIHSHRHSANTGLFVAHQGKLKYFEMSGMFISGDQFPSFKLCVLNDYGSSGGENWCLMHDISYRDVQHDTSITFNIKVSTLVPIDFHPFDSDLVYLGYSDLLVTYNIKTGKLEVQQKCSTGGTSCRRRVYWRFLLVIPPWPISIPLSPFAGAVEG